MIVRPESSEHMRIQCPSCAAIYEVGPGLLDQPRTVRCAQCGNDWVATAMPEPAHEPVASVAEPVPDHQPDPARDAHSDGRDHVIDLDHEPASGHEPGHDQPTDVATAEPPSHGADRLPVTEEDLTPANNQRRNFYLTLAWVASFLMLLMFVGVARHERDRVMASWPASKPLYALFGLTPHDSE